MADLTAIFERIEKITTQTVIIDEQVYEYASTENEGTAIILINGAGGPIDGWMKLWRRLREKHRLFCYNRPGMGQSSPPVIPQTGLQMAQELRALLFEVKIEPPYILVGHSLGGFIAELFARHFPEEIKSVVLLEPSTIDDFLSNKKKDRKPKNPAQSLTEIFQVRETVTQLQAAPSFPPLHLAVVAGTHPVAKNFMPTKMMFKRIEHLRKAAQMSPYGQFVIAYHSGHFPQLSDSKLVAEVIEGQLLFICQN